MTTRPALLAILALAPFLSACASFTNPTGSSTIEFASNTTGAAVKPRITLRVYSTDDPTSADIYLTDLPALADPSVTSDALSRATGHLIHIHMFIVPKAGKTPIEYTAANTTITHIILADGAMGVYRGGGFLLPSGKPGRSSFGGKMAQATLRPVSATSGFVDLLNWNEASGQINASLDEATSRALDARIATLLHRNDLTAID